LAYAGVEYEDVRIPIGALSEEKKMGKKPIPHFLSFQTVITKNVFIQFDFESIKK